MSIYEKARDALDGTDWTDLFDGEQQADEKCRYAAEVVRLHRELIGLVAGFRHEAEGWRMSGDYGDAEQAEDTASRIQQILEGGDHE